MAAVAPFALPARLRRVHGDERTRIEARALRGLRGNDTRELMAQHVGDDLGPPCRAALKIGVQVAAADPDRLHLDQDLSVPRNRPLDLVEADIPDGMQDGGAHQRAPHDVVTLQKCRENYNCHQCLPTAG